MRIVHLVANLDTGGLERQVVDLAREQALSGDHPSIYCLFNDGELAPEALKSGLAVTAFRKPPGLSLQTLLDIVAQMKIDRPDVLHTHNAVVHHYGVAAAKLAHVPRIVNTQHGTGTLSRDARLARIFRFSTQWTDSVVMVSEEVRSFLVAKRGIPSEKTAVILNGVPLSRFQSHLAKPGSRLPVIRFGSVGRLAREKDHATLIEAFLQVRAHLPSAELHIAGDGPLRQTLNDQIARLGLTQNVTLHGMRNDIGRFLADLDVFVLSSLTEGLPLVLLEASAVGLPIVSTRVGGVGEIAAAGQFEFCVPGSPYDLAQSMLSLAGRDLPQLGASIRLLSASQGIEHTAHRYRSLILELGA